MTHGNAPATPRSTLVVTAHAGDFVWRAGGAIALAAARGEKVTIACLTFGERGESAKAWREGKKLDEIKAIRRDEAERPPPPSAPRSASSTPATTPWSPPPS
jgi:4-oxalomesaconate hydratase